MGGRFERVVGENNIVNSRVNTVDTVNRVDTVFLYLPYLPYLLYLLCLPFYQPNLTTS